MTVAVEHATAAGMVDRPNRTGRPRKGQPVEPMRKMVPTRQPVALLDAFYGAADAAGLTHAAAVQEALEDWVSKQRTAVLDRLERDERGGEG